ADGDGDGANNLPPTDRPWLYPLIGVIVGGLASAIPIAIGMGRPDLFPQTWDAVFHLNAVRYILDSGQASTLTLNAIASDHGAPGLYPAAWHGIIALSTIRSVLPATNAMVLALAGIIWPAGLAAFALALTPRRPWLALIAPILGAGMFSFPTRLITWGTLWPNALSYSLIPAVTACTLMAVKPARNAAHKTAWILAAGIGLGGIAFAQPSGLLIYAIIVTPALAAAVMTAVRANRGSGRIIPAVTLLAWLAAWAGVYHLFVDQLGGTAWQGDLGFIAGVGGAVADGFLDSIANIALLALLTVGCLTALLTRGRRWLLVSLAAILLLNGLSQQVTPLSWLIQPWFADPMRLLAAVPIIAVTVMAVGVDAAVEQAIRWLQGRQQRTASSTGCWIRPAALSITLALIAAATLGLQAGRRYERVNDMYVGQTRENLLDQIASLPEIEMLERLGGPQADTPLTAGRRILGSPFSGAALAYAIANVPVVFPHFAGQWSADARFIASNFDQIHDNPDVCAALDRLDVGYFYVDWDRFFPDSPARENFAALDLFPQQPGFDLVDAGGSARLYRITACG
ncbi:MAG: hypothetical protein LBB54_04090, partial [Cellulomonadaceae bacterium]|nr:hypothetical protein [Cellulomonadaceae bacterium]